MSSPAPYPDFDGTQACHGADHDQFFPDSATADQVLEHVAPVCAACSWRRPCLAFALTHAVDGLWAGTTEVTRAALRVRHGITATPLIPDDPRSRPETTQEQQVWDLHVHEGLSAYQIASQLGISRGAAASHLSRRRQKERDSA